MKREDILRMAREAGFKQYHNSPIEWHMVTEDIERFATLVAAHEREACAKIAWNHEPDENGPIETAIHARGEKP